MPRPIDMAITILQKTNDGDDLAPEHLYLVQEAVNGHLSEQGEVAFYQLYESVLKGYKKPWLHGIEHLTIDHAGRVYWKGKQVEHYDFPWAYSEAAKSEAQEIARRCQILEGRGIDPDTTSVCWKWEGELRD
jgi:hypothetical protein